MKRGRLEKERVASRSSGGPGGRTFLSGEETLGPYPLRIPLFRNSKIQALGEVPNRSAGPGDTYAKNMPKRKFSLLEIKAAILPLRGKTSLILKGKNSAGNRPRLEWTANDLYTVKLSPLMLPDLTSRFPNRKVPPFSDVPGHFPGKGLTSSLLPYYDPS